MLHFLSALQHYFVIVQYGYTRGLTIHYVGGMLFGVFSIIACVGLLKAQLWGVYMTMIVAAISGSILIIPSVDFGFVPNMYVIPIVTILAAPTAIASAIMWFVSMYQMWFYKVPERVRNRPLQ